MIYFNIFLILINYTETANSKGNPATLPYYDSNSADTVLITMTGGALCFTVCSKQYDTVNTKQLVDKKGKIERRSNTEYTVKEFYTYTSLLTIILHYIILERRVERKRHSQHPLFTF
jgi:hypothetical protein